MRFLLPTADGKNAAFLLTGHIHGRITGSSDLTFLQSSVLRLAVHSMRGTEIFRILDGQQLSLTSWARLSSESLSDVMQTLGFRCLCTCANELYNPQEPVRG